MSQPAAESASPSLLTVNDIEVIYDGAILAVAGVSLSVHKGAIVALLGANGAGKSTTPGSQGSRPSATPAPGSPPVASSKWSPSAGR